jgi:uncharacterized membrane protein
MNATETTKDSCTEPPVFEALTAYCFGDLDAEGRERVSLHVLACGRCSRELERLEAGVQALKRDPYLQPLAATPEVVSVLGISGWLDQPFGGHLRHAVAAGSLFALLHAVPVVVEIAYEFETFGSRAVPLSLLAFVWMLSSTLVGLWLAVDSVRKGQNGLHRSLFVWLAATATLSLGLWAFLPSRPTVEAAFGTWPANLAYLKSVFYAWLVGPLYLLWPFSFVLLMQRELARGRHRAVLALVTGARDAVAPPGVLQPNVWALTVLLAALFVFNYVGVNHLFSALHEDPYANLFRTLVLVRASAWLVLPAVCLWWYVRSLNDIKREAILGSRLLNG